MYTMAKALIPRGKLDSKECKKYLINCQFYHSDNGVYGYKPTPRRAYTGNKEYQRIRSRNSNFYRLVTAYRKHAHKIAHINPISTSRPDQLDEFNLERYGLNPNETVTFEGIFNKPDRREGTVLEAVQFLNTIYCANVGFEFNHLETEEEREWFAQTVEQTLIEPIDESTKRSLAIEMLKSQTFDHFLGIKFVTLKRYSGEGAESALAFFHQLFHFASLEHLEQIVLALPHRGRLNLLTGMLNVPLEKLFHKLKGLSEFPNDVKSAIGDVTSHLTASVDLNVNERKVHVTVLRNPSHLEAVNSVSMGKTRGIMQAIKDGAYDQRNDQSRWSNKALNVQIHGDAAYPGQGINQECLALSRVAHFEIGGSIHMIVNNQLGFTTPSTRGRSSRYCTDLAKFINAPVIHVNGDDPEMVARATRIAFRYQRKFRKDVFVDLNCYRKWGHNELDDPTFTNPVIYRIINSRKSVPDLYLETLDASKTLTKREAAEIVGEYTFVLSDAFRNSDKYVPEKDYFGGRWTGFRQAQSDQITYWNTGIDIDLMKFLGIQSVQVPSDWKVHPQLLKNHIKGRIKKINDGTKLDWATAESLAFGALLYEGYNVRLSGQDVGRGTFSHRHAMIVDQTTGAIHIPLNSMTKDQIGQIEIANSILSEEAVLGYEYGMSIAQPTTLTIWEAQFGDFFNGAQIIIDTFVTSGEVKWMLSSGLMILLPHGYDGAGPEHSSCRLERFLQSTDSKENHIDTDNVNMEVVYPTTPAQYFHFLRRQMVRDFRKPSIVVGPKILLRHNSATSSLSDMGPGTFFKNVIGDEKADPSEVDKVILVSGKHYYALDDHREKIMARNVAIVRLESLCPFPVNDLLQEIKKYKKTKVFIWSQEEPQNMGAWSFVKPRFENLCGQRLKYSGREAIAAPAVGEAQLHQRQAQEIVFKPFSMN